MNKKLFLAFFTLISLICAKVHAQAVYTYTSDVGGAPAFVTTGLSAANLTKINGGTNTPCSSGFSGFTVPTTYTSYSPSNPAINLDLTPNAGYVLKVTSVSVGIRRSGTGPNNARLAYSIDGGATWVDKGSDDFPNNSGCGSMSTATWTFPCTGGVIVGNPNYFKFRLYYFNASNSSGTTQVMNLTINGTCTNTCTATASISGSTSFCNSGSTNIIFTGTPNATVTYTKNAGPNQTILLNCAGTATLNTGVLTTTTVYSLVSAAFGNCSQPASGTATVTIVVLPTISTTFTNPTTCGGTDGGITINGLNTGSSYTVHYTQNGNPLTFTATAVAGSIVIPSLSAGSYTAIFVSQGTCNSNTIAGPILLVDPVPPTISISASVNPSTCGGTDGSITIGGLVTGTTYTVNYFKNGNPQTLSATAVAGAIVIANLSAGSYTNFSVNVTNCTSNVIAGPVTLSDPPTPVISSAVGTNPSTCSGTDGYITLSTLLPNTLYTVNYSFNNVPQTALSISSDAAGNIKILNLVAGTYSIIVSRLGCVSNTAGPVTLIDPPTPFISGTAFTDPTTCSGSDGTITLSGLLATTQYMLNYTAPSGPVAPASFTTNISGEIVITGLVAGLYNNFKVVSAACTSNTVGPVTLSSPAIPVITNVSSSDPTVCGGTDGTITLAGLAVNAAYSVTYTTTGGPQGPFTLSTNAAAVLVIPGLSADTYSNIVVTRFNCPSAPAGPITLSNPPLPTIANVTHVNPSNCGIADGSITLAGLLPNTAYTVTYNIPAGPQGPFSLTTNAAGEILLQNLLADGYYNIVVTRSGCSSAPVGPVALTTVASPVISNVAHIDPSVCGGNQGTITLSGLLGNTTYSVYYNQNGLPQGPFSIATNPSGNLVIGGLIAAVYDNIYVVIGNCNSNIVGPVTLTDPVQSNPPQVTMPQFCQGEIVTQPLSDFVNGVNLLWYTTPTGGTGNTTPPTVNTAIPDTTTYYVSQNATGCESNRSSITVTIIVKPVTPAAVATYTYCQYDNNATALTATGTNIKWYNQPTGGAALAGAPVPATGTAGTYTWYVTQTINTCESDRLPIVVTINAKPSVPTVTDITLCEGDVPQPLSAVGQSLKWYASASGGSAQTDAPFTITSFADTTTWYVSQTVLGCESDRAAITYIVNTRPTAQIISSSNTICQYDTVSFSHAGNAPAGSTYNWTVPAGATIVENKGDHIRVYFEISGDLSVSLIVDNLGCKSPEAIYNLNIIRATNVTLDVPSAACQGDTITVVINSISNSVDQYVWNFDAAHIIPQKDQQMGGPYRIKWANAGSHFVSLEVLANGCYSKNMVDSVSVYPYPEVKILPLQRDNICAGDTIIMSAQVFNDADRYEWLPWQYFDMGNTSPIAAGSIDQTGFVKLRTTSHYGCIATDSIWVTTQPCCNVSFPTAFTPNGDGKNDLFRPITEGNHVISFFRIINRWGQVVYETMNEQRGWDGRFGGVPQDMGTYFYEIKYNCNGKMIDSKGDVTLIR